MIRNRLPALLLFYTKQHKEKMNENNKRELNFQTLKLEDAVR